MAEPRAGLFQLDREAETSPRRLAILIAGGAIALLLLLWLFREEPQASVEPESESTAALPTAPPAPVPAETAPPAAPDISVAALRLHGVMGTGDNGAAIVSEGAGPQRLVRVGRDVLPGATLLAVAGDHILIRENGREVRLAFADDDGGTATVSTANPPSGGDAGPRGSEAERREALEYQAAVTSFRVDGRHAGYRFREGRMPEIFERAGIRPDDVLLRFGGFRLESNENVAAIPGRIREGGQIEIEILRNGQEQTIVMDAR